MQVKVRHLNILFLLISLVSGFIIIGCDSAYRYVFLPPERVTTILVPDSILIKSTNDTIYSVSKDGNSAVFDRKDYKVEIKYMSDYQLNNFEFPEESRNGEFSANPYTYGNWVDQTTGHTPNRFTVFKVTVYNYAAAKINVDPENIILMSERGDNLLPYGREQKTARYQSMEGYFKRRAGSGGVQDDIFEGRMGIVRNTMITYGKPLFRGDTRQGILVFDPIPDEADKIKMTIKNFILAYDENNEPSEFVDIVFYFKKSPFIAPKDQHLAGGSLMDSSNIFVLPDIDSKKISGEVSITLLQFPATNVTSVGQEYWNPAPEAGIDLVKYINENTQFKATYNVSNIESNEFKKSKVAFILGQSCAPTLTDTMVGSLTDFVKNGGFLYVDNCDAFLSSSFGQVMENVFQAISNRIGSDSKVQKIPMSNPIFSIYKKFKSVPPGHESFMEDRVKEQTVEYLMGLYIKGKIVGVLSHKGYAKAWGLWKKGGRDIDNTQQLNLGVNIITYSVASNLKNKSK
jgi:hypothetical protein